MRSAGGVLAGVSILSTSIGVTGGRVRDRVGHRASNRTSAGQGQFLDGLPRGPRGYRRGDVRAVGIHIRSGLDVGHA